MVSYNDNVVPCYRNRTAERFRLRLSVLQDLQRRISPNRKIDKHVKRFLLLQLRTKMRCYSPDGHPRFRPLRRQIAPGPTDVVDRFWPSINTLGRKHGYVFLSVGMGSRR